MPTSTKLFNSTDIQHHFYNSCAEEIRSEFEAWVLSMTPELDRETGGGPDGALAWVKAHNATFIPEGMYQTHILCHKQTGEVVATISIVPDDRDIGKIYNVGGDGFWGFGNVRRDLRGRGLGRILFQYCDSVCQVHANKLGRELTFSGFTGNPISVHFLTNIGFTFQRQIVRQDLNNAVRDLYSKTYTPNASGPNKINAPVIA
jgi:GNAT superfamily N-acetyltransferase